MEIKTVNIKSISPAVYNPRIELASSDREYIKLKRSIENFGYIDPLIWNKQTGNLVGGHHEKLPVLGTFMNIYYKSIKIQESYRIIDFTSLNIQL